MGGKGEREGEKEMKKEEMVVMAGGRRKRKTLYPPLFCLCRKAVLASEEWKYLL